jgi:hypothetical protein
LADRLDKLDLRTLLDLIKLLGSPPRAKRRSRRKVTPDQASSVFEGAAKILDRWPGEFHRLIGEWEHPDQTLTLFRATLTHDFLEGSLQFLDDEYRSYVSQRRVQRSFLASFENLSPGQQRKHYVSVSRAAEETGIGYWTIVRQIPSGELPTGKSKRPIRHVRRSDLSLLATSHDVTKWCTPAAALRGYLGPLPQRRFNSLIASGHITTKKLGARQYLEISSLNALVRRVEVLASLSTGRITDPVSLGNHPTTSKVSGTCGVDLVLEGAIDVYELWSGKVGLSRFAVSERELLFAGDGAASTFITAPGAAKALSLDRAVLLRILQEGLLDFERTVEGGLRVSKVSLAAFRTNYWIATLPVWSAMKTQVEFAGEVLLKVKAKNAIYIVGRSNSPKSDLLRFT